MTSSSFEDNLAVLGYGGAWNLGGLECEEHNWVSIFGVGIHCTCTEREREREGETESLSGLVLDAGSKMQHPFNVARPQSQFNNSFLI